MSHDIFGLQGLDEGLDGFAALKSGSSGFVALSDTGAAQQAPAAIDVAAADVAAVNLANLLAGSGSAADVLMPVAALVPSGAAPSSRTPFYTTSWAGITQAATGLNPPDTNMAVGTRDVITVVNSTITTYTRNGVLESQATLQSFFGITSTNFVFDPRVTWDQYSGRFIVIADDQTGTNSVVHVAVSKTSNPADGWWKFDINTKFGNSWLDYPEIGMDDTNIYITGNMFDLTTSAFTSSRMYVINKNTLEAGIAPTVSSYDSYSDILPASFSGSLYTAAHMYGNRAGLNGTFLITYRQNNAGNDSVDIIRTDNTGGTLNFVNRFGGISTNPLDVGNISDLAPVGARQSGTTTLIDTGDNRTLNSIWRDNRLYATTEVRVGAGAAAHDVVHWFEFDTTDLNNVTLLHQGNIDYGSGVDTYYGNITADTQGNIILGFSYSSTTSFGSSVFQTILPDGTFSDSGRFLTQGLAANTGGRWGDYSGLAIDPVDNRGFGVFNQFATASNSWATTVGLYNASNNTGSHVKTNDFNGNATSDILWQNDDGTITFWKTSGTTVTGGGFSLNPGASWHAIGSGDLNGDGYADILLQNNDGTVAAWQVRDNGIIGGSAGIINPGASWKVIGSGDFNGDGKGDIVLQNTDGSIINWFMNGAGIIGGGLVINPGADWKVVGSGDFNGDGKGDLILRNQVSGAITEWNMNGTGIIGGGQSANPGVNFSIKGIADFNGDGTSDLVLQNSVTLDVYVWLMQSQGIIGGGLVGNPGPGWNIVGAGDFNGDGKGDILWQNTNGTLDIWNLNGSTNTIGQVYGNPGSTWHAIAH